jgi:hypothetical protein
MKEFVCHEAVAMADVRCTREPVQFWMAAPLHEPGAELLPMCACARHHPNYHFEEWRLQKITRDEYEAALVLGS